VIQQRAEPQASQRHSGTAETPATRRPRAPSHARHEAPPPRSISLQSAVMRASRVAADETCCGAAVTGGRSSSHPDSPREARTEPAEGSSSAVLT
jgi:hypothetical protein